MNLHLKLPICSLHAAVVLADFFTAMLYRKFLENTYHNNLGTPSTLMGLIVPPRLHHCLASWLTVLHVLSSLGSLEEK